MITQKTLKEWVNYYPLSGNFYWLKGKNIHKMAGSKNSQGYYKIRICGSLIPAHKLAWLYVTGKWPTNEIDHKDCDPSNNCFDNLREATHAENCRNRRKRSDLTSRFKGVSWKKRNKKWCAQIKTSGKVYHLGLFHTEELAHQSYQSKAIQLFKEFARLV